MVGHGVMSMSVTTAVGYPEATFRKNMEDSSFWCLLTVFKSASRLSHSFLEPIGTTITAIDLGMANAHVGAISGRNIAPRRGKAVRMEMWGVAHTVIHLQ
jgi:hypothetical protein